MAPQGPPPDEVGNPRPPGTGVLRRGLSCRCPRCGEGRLFSGFLTLAPRCEHCGLDYDFADAGDGPAVFVIMLVGFLIVALVLVSEVTLHPPIWLHMVVWLPLTILVSLAILRPLKGVLIALQFGNNAREGRVDEGVGTPRHHD